MAQTPKQGRNFYDVLGVVRTATPQEIEGAFRHLARQWHPDVCPDIHEAAENFKLIAEAYEVLGDAEKRRQYDDAQARSRRRTVPTGPRRPQPTRRYRQPVNIAGLDSFPDELAELIRSMFGAAARPVSRERAASGSRRGSTDLDVEAELPLLPEEANHGGTVRFSVSFPQQCPECQGRGAAIGESCRTCGGAGSIRQGPRPVSVDVPPGVWTGAVIRVPGQGNLSPESGATGDLCLRVRVEPCC